MSGNINVINGVTANAGNGSSLQVFDTINVSPTNSVATANINLAATAMAMGAANAPVFNGVTNFVFTNGLGVNSFAANQIAPNATSISFSPVTGQAAATTNTINGAGANLNTFTLSGADFAASNFTVNFSAGTRTGTTDAVSFNSINNATAAGGGASTVAFVGAAGGQGAEIVNLNVVGTNVLTALTSLDNAATRLTTLNIAGTGSVTIEAPLAFTGTTSTINASTNAGGFDLIVAGNTATAVTGGTGNDTFRFAAANEFTAADSINLGTGTNTLVLADVAFGTNATANLNALINGVTTAQIIGIGGINGNYDLSRITQNTFQLFNTGSTFTNVSAADTLTVIGRNAGALTAQGALGFNTVNLSLQSDTFNTVAALGAVDFTNQATINIATNRLGSTNTVNTIGAITNSINANITITGNAGVTIDSIAQAASVSASALVRPLTITTTNAGASSVTGGSGNDTINSGTAADTIIGGAGQDRVTVGATAVNGARYQLGLAADVLILSDIAADASRTATLAVTAAESFATAGQFDIITFNNQTVANAASRVLTTATGVNATSVSALANVVVGTTAVTANAFVIGGTGNLVGSAAGTYQVFQDSNGNGVIDATDLRFDTILNGNDTITFALAGNQLAITQVGVA